MEDSDAQKQECQVLTEEYKRISSEIQKRLDYIDRNISYQFVLLGIVVTAITTFLSKDAISHVDNFRVVQYILLGSPIVFHLLGFYYSINNMFILELGQYISKHIKPRLSHLLGSASILGFDQHFQDKVLKSAKRRNKSIALITLQWTLGIPILLLTTYLIIRFYQYTDENKEFDWHFFGKQKLLFVVNILALFIAYRVNNNQYKIIERNSAA